ncbi:MAG TPA: hypothetical protein VN380_18910 [Thermoanaerobaculia bacterium]|jgi:hypothetical protein|nr:hypothetical protein [Thermoanaerobaculia bacterium]
MSTTSAELSGDLVIGRIDAGQFPREVVETIARGFLPLPQDDLIAVLAYLTRSPDGEIADAAARSLADVPSRSIHAFASNESAPPTHLVMLMRASEDPFILEALIRNRAVPDDLITELASVADAAVQEVIVINHSRILRAPEILDALLANPALSADVRRRALEAREEFFEKKARIVAQQPAEVEVDEDEPMLSLSEEPIADLLEKAVEEPQSDAPPPELNETEQKDEKKLSIFSQILLMGVSDKVKLAFKGGKTERVILVRDHNKLVCSAVMRNPRMSVLEAESIAGMRNVEEEVLRLITLRREWVSKYNIVIALARNPKCPVGVVVPLINRLTLRDLKGLKDDKGVSETVRALARKLFAQRSIKS